MSDIKITFSHCFKGCNVKQKLVERFFCIRSYAAINFSVVNKKKYAYYRVFKCMHACIFNDFLELQILCPNYYEMKLISNKRDAKWQYSIPLFIEL